MAITTLAFDRTAIAIVLILGVFILAPPTATASNVEDTVEQTAEQTDAASRIFDSERFFVMPIPISNPTIGTGLGLSTMYLFQAGENAPPSSVNLVGFYADSKSWAGALGTETYFRDDKYRLSGWVGYYDANLEFYGVGSGAGDRGESIGINQRGPMLLARFLARIASSLFIGPQYRYIANETALQDPILPPDLPGDLIPSSIKNVTSGLGVVLEHDTRDSKFSPLEGSYAELLANFAHEKIGSDNNYEQYEVSYNRFGSIGEGKVLAWRATGCFRGGDTPYYDLCMFGGESDAIRGYIGGQYRDKVSVTTQLEYRWRFRNKWGMVFFGGIGQVAPKLSEIDLGDLLPSAGVGLRFMASEEERVNLGVDFAVGKDSNAWYFRIGEAF